MTYMRPTLALDNLGGMVQCQTMLMSAMQNKSGRLVDLLLPKSEKMVKGSLPSFHIQSRAVGCGSSLKTAIRSAHRSRIIRFEQLSKKANETWAFASSPTLCAIAQLNTPL